ncbi:MAG: hypothetical protein V4642_00970 [Bacteroidota bacterium]
MKNSVRFSTFFVCALLFAITGCTDDPVTPPTPTELQMNVGDWSRYEHFTLDSNNQMIASTRFVKSRTVVQKDLVVHGQSNVIKMIDSVFLPTGALKSVDSSFFKISNQKLYVYNFAKLLAGAAPASMGLKSVPTWVAIGSTDSTASNLVMKDSLMIEVGTSGVQAMQMMGKASGNSSMSNTAQTTFGVVRTDWTVKAGIGGTTVDIPIEFNFGKGTGSSPVTIVGVQLSGFTAVDTKVSGQRYNLLEFKKGQ